jgi:hypothetical protein
MLVVMGVSHDVSAGRSDEAYGTTTIERLLDRFTTPMTVSLSSGPGDGGYARIETVCVGRKLRLPEPFDVTLDTASLPSPRRGDRPSE